VSSERKLPNIVVVAANTKGEIERYYEAGEMAPYFGSALARDPATGLYAREHEGRMIASTGKVLAAIAIANSGRDGPGTLYLDTLAPAQGLETCAKGNQRRGRTAEVAFACSLNDPLLNRTAQAGQARMRLLIDRFGFTMPPRSLAGEDTPPSTAAVLGQIGGSPRRVHHMSATVLAAMLGQDARPVPMPSLIKAYEYTGADAAGAILAPAAPGIIPSRVIKRSAVPLLRALLQAPVCYEVNGIPMGTLKSLSKWCAARRPGVRLHFAKTGTQVTQDPSATVDVWVTGGIQFASGAAYSYVVLVGTGSPREPWATSLHAAQVAAPLVDALLTDLAPKAPENLAPASRRPSSGRPLALSSASPGDTEKRH
jgi:membrane peptidoglycan carboxypeptidase